MKCHAVVVKDPKKMSLVLSYVNKQMPLGVLSFLRRVQKKTEPNQTSGEGSTEYPVVLLGVVDVSVALSAITNFKQNFLETDFPIILVDVPFPPPCTLEQHEQWQSIWPVNLNAVEECVNQRKLFPLHSRSTPSTSIFSDDDLLKMKEYMQMAFEQAKMGSDSGNVSIILSHVTYFMDFCMCSFLFCLVLFFLFLFLSFWFVLFCVVFMYLYIC